MISLNWPVVRQALVVLGLAGLQYFSWASHSVTLFNGLASPLFFALSAYLIFLATQYRISVSPKSLALYLLFTAWVVFADTRSGEFMPALAMDTHWFVLPISVLLMAQVFREYPLAFQAIRVGAALCIINLLLTMYLNAEWYWHWHYPPIFGHIRHLGLSIGFMVILLFTKNDVQGWAAVFFRVTRIVGLALVFWSGTRASMLAWVFCMAIYIYTDRNWAKTLLIDTLIAVSLSLIPDPPTPESGYLNVFRRTLSSTNADALSSSRLSIWKSTLIGLESIDRLWTGIGGNGFARLQILYQAQITPPGHVHAHNIVIQSICDWGLIGLALLIAFSGQSVARPVIGARTKNDPTALSGVAYLLITGLLDSTLFHLEHLNYLAFSLAYLISQRQGMNAIRTNISTTLLCAALLGFCAIHALVTDYRIGILWYFPTR